MAKIKCKADVQTSYHQGSHDLPMVNVKIHGWGMRDVDYSELDIAAEDAADFGWDWIESHLTEQQIDGWWSLACEHGWEDAERDAEEIFGPNVNVYSEGRCGGWLVVSGLPDVESWDAIMLSKWKRFAKWVRAAADYVPSSAAELIYINVYETEREKWDAALAEDAAAHLPIMLAE